MTPALDRLGALTTTGVGSLPFAAPTVAARHAVRAYDLPFCPQLPRADGDMVREWLGRAGCEWSPDRDRERPAAWEPFLEALTAAPAGHGMVKLQVTGPVTLAAALERRAGAGASLALELALWLAANAAQQVRVLQGLGFDVLLMVDEPGLADADFTVWDALQSTGACAWGLHICGPVPWGLVEAAEPDVISFDLARYGIDGPARACLARQLARGRRVAWGVLDPVEPDGVPATAARLAGAVASLATPHLPLARVAALSLATPTCGTGRLTAAQERLVAATLSAAAITARAAVAAMTPA
jgi:hypothetical protein